MMKEKEINEYNCASMVKNPKVTGFKYQAVDVTLRPFRKVGMILNVTERQHEEKK